jgi:hypothetical protein
VDGDTIYGCISSDKQLLLKFLEKYNHEGSMIVLMKDVRDAEHEFGFNPVEVPMDEICQELGHCS